MFDFSHALTLLKSGYCVKRTAWAQINGPTPYLYLVSGSSFPVNRPPLNYLLAEGTKVSYKAHINKLTIIDGTVHAETYNFSNDDILSDDWIIAKKE